MERIAWGVAIAASITWGAIRDTPGEPSHPGGTVADSPKERSRPSARERHNERTARPDRGTSEQSSPRARSLQALRNADPLQRASGFLRALSSCDARGLEEITAAFDELKAEGIALPEEESWLRFREGQLDGASLLADRRGSPADISDLGALAKNFEGWVSADPYSAGGWLEALPPGKFRDRLAVIHIAASTKEDPAMALKNVSALHPSQRATAGREVAQHLAESLSPGAASSLLESMVSGAGGENETYLENLFDSIITRAASGDEDLATSLVESHLGQPYALESSIARVPAALAGKDPVRAMEWATEIESRQSMRTGSMASAAIQGMTLEGLGAAEHWLTARATQPGNESLLSDIHRRRDQLEDRGASRNGYDADN